MSHSGTFIKRKGGLNECAAGYASSPSAKYPASDFIVQLQLQVRRRKRALFLAESADDHLVKDRGGSPSRDRDKEVA